LSIDAFQPWSLPCHRSLICSKAFARAMPSERERIAKIRDDPFK